jgi:hypothetical protein
MVVLLSNCHYLQLHPLQFLDVFPEDLPGMPPDRDVEFTIELQLGTASISRRSYKMTPKKLAELNDQMNELLDKGYICPSSSPWGCQSLFVKKKDQLFFTLGLSSSVCEEERPIIFHLGVVQHYL